MEYILKTISGVFGLFKRTKHDAPHPTLRFHSTHGSNIVVSENGALATRARSYNNGIVFSDRPILINETVPVKITEVQKYLGPLFFGLTTIDPASLNQEELRAIRSPENYGLYGVWLKGLHRFEMRTNLTLSFKVLPNADVQYAVNGNQYVTQFRGLQMDVPLWAIFDVYGNAGGIQFIDFPELQFHQRTSPTTIFNDPGSDSEDSISSDDWSTTGYGSPTTSYEFRTPPPPTRATSTASEDIVSSVPTGTENACIICTDHPATTAFVKCGHMCLCYDCALRFLDSSKPGFRRKIYSCPVCRGPVLDILRIYVP